MTLDAGQREPNTALPWWPSPDANCTRAAAAVFDLASVSLNLGVPLTSLSRRRLAVPRSLLEAIKQGDFTFEPPTGEQPVHVKATAALPGTSEKLDVLAERLRQGLPLWHPSDRRSYDDKVQE